MAVRSILNYLRPIQVIMVLFLISVYTYGQEYTAHEVVAKIKKSVNCEWKSPTVDTFKAGLPTTEVLGVACVFMPTMDVLKAAKNQGLNFIISHEPTFYNHLDKVDENDRSVVLTEKLKFIEDNGMVIWRFHDHMHKTKPDQIYEGVINKLDWKKYQISKKPIFHFQSRSLESIALELKAKLKANTIRIVGKLPEQFTKVAMVLGAAGSEAHFKMLSDPDCEVLIVGESNEWETVPYVQDAISQGHKKALIVLGHADSEEGGMIYFKEWLQELYPNMKIRYIPTGNPYVNILGE